MSETVVDQLEQELRAASARLTSPAEGECLHCFVWRMLDEFGCSNRLSFAVHYRDLKAPRATALEKRLGDMGGFCDCEILLNGPTPIDGRGAPRCSGVRRGSTRPCAQWVRRQV